MRINDLLSLMNASGTAIREIVMEIMVKPIWVLVDCVELLREALGVDDARLVLLEPPEDDRLVLVDEVALLDVLISALVEVEELSPELEEGVKVLTVPLEADDVRPEVLCAAALVLEVLVPWI